MAFQPDHRLAGQVLHTDVFLPWLQPAVGRQELQLALGNDLALNVLVLRIMQAQPQIALTQQQAFDDLASGQA
ncbi:hypothetical protein D3C80_1335930 [compost metagenome]